MWVNTVNGKRYIGITGTTMEKRAGKDGYHYKGSPKFYAAINKYGFESFKCYILEDGLTQDAAAEKEKLYIKMYDSMNPDKGYNLQDGGFPEHQTDSRSRAEKISATLKAERSSPEYRKIMSSRMQKVWDDPARKADLITRRNKTLPIGPRSISIYCVELATWFTSQEAFANKIGVHKSTISARLMKDNGRSIIHTKAGKIYTVMTRDVYNKESELLEASAGKAGGNQQPTSK
jgi:group I intron endonuclease